MFGLSVPHIAQFSSKYIIKYAECTCNSKLKLERNYRQYIFFFDIGLSGPMSGRKFTCEILLFEDMRSICIGEGEGME